MNNPPDLYDELYHEKHSAWLASLSADELLVVRTPVGYLHTFIAVSLMKRALLTEGIKPAEQLDLLEKMNSWLDLYFTREMLATIEPICDTGYAIFAEAKSLDRPADKLGQASFEVLTCPRVFWHLTTLNPSILAAIKLKEAARAAPLTL